MPLSRRLWISMLGNVVLSGPAVCRSSDGDLGPPIVQTVPGVQFRGCAKATISGLWKDPWPYAGKRVCVSGYLVRMIPYGEEDVEFVPSQIRAKEKPSKEYLRIGVQLTMSAQIELSKYSE